MTRSGDDLSDDEYRALLRFRTGLRRFLHWSAERAKEAGLTAAQHQLLLAVRGHAGGGDRPTITDVADALLMRHHSAVELIDRAERAGLVHRMRDISDHRVVRIALTAEGSRKLASLSAQHRAELDRLGPQMRDIWKGLGDSAAD